MSVIKRRKVMMAAVIAAIAVFVASAIAAGANLSGYERLKDAGFQLINDMNKTNGVYSNGTYWINMVFYVDGSEVLRTEQTVMMDGSRELESNTRTSNGEGYAGAPFFSYPYNDHSVTYTDKDVVYRWHGNGGFQEYDNFYGKYRRQNDAEYDDAVLPAQRRFMEAIADALIGETRNYFIAYDNVVSISLSGNQIPEIAQYAMAAFAERASDMGAYNDEDGHLIGADARFSNGMLEIRFGEGNMIIGGELSVEIVSTVNGQPRSYRAFVEYSSMNIGTTTVPKPEKNQYGMPVLPSFNEDGAVTFALPALFI